MKKNNLSNVREGGLHFSEMETSWQDQIVLFKKVKKGPLGTCITTPQCTKCSKNGTIKNRRDQFTSILIQKQTLHLEITIFVIWNFIMISTTSSHLDNFLMSIESQKPLTLLHTPVN